MAMQGRMVRASQKPINTSDIDNVFTKQHTQML